MNLMVKYQTKQMKKKNILNLKLIIIIKMIQSFLNFFMENKNLFPFVTIVGRQYFHSIFLIF